MCFEFLKIACRSSLILAFREMLSVTGQVEVAQRVDNSQHVIRGHMSGLRGLDLVLGEILSTLFMLVVTSHILDLG